MDIVAFSIIMHLCHYNFDKLPWSISFETLFDLAGFADEFELTRLLLPFTRPWLTQYADYKIDTTLHEWMLISWAFGLKAVFCACLHQVVQTTHVSEEGSLITAQMERRHLPIKAADMILGRLRNMEKSAPELTPNDRSNRLSAHQQDRRIVHPHAKILSFRPLLLLAHLPALLVR